MTNQYDAFSLIPALKGFAGKPRPPHGTCSFVSNQEPNDVFQRVARDGHDNNTTKE